MHYPQSFRISTPSEREIEIVRDFDAPRELVFDAFTKPELVRQWLLGPGGWTMPVCDIDLKVGGSYRYVWRKKGVPDMGMGGVFREIVRPRLIAATERFDDAWYPGEALNTTIFERREDVTRVTITVLYESREARDIASRSGMERGMIAGFDRLEALIVRGIAGPVVIDSERHTAAVIHLKIPRNQIQTELPPAIQELMAAAAGQGLRIVGPLFTHHLTTSPTDFDFEAGFPVSAPVKPQGRVKPGELPAARIARSEYRGGYEGLYDAWRQFGEWMNVQGLKGRGDLWERYLAGPESSADPATWRTELCLPLDPSHGR